MRKKIHKLARFVQNLKQEYRKGMEDEEGEEEAKIDSE